MGRNRRITALMLNKLAYLAQVEHLRRVGTPLFDDAIEARESGPIEPMIERAYESYGSEAVAEPLAYVTLDDASRASVEAAMDRFGTKTSLELVTCCRMPGGAWSKAYDPEHGAVIYPDTIVASTDARGMMPLVLQGIRRRNRFHAQCPQAAGERMMAPAPEAFSCRVLARFFGQRPSDRYVDVFEQVSVLAEHLMSPPCVYARATSPYQPQRGCVCTP